MEYVAIQGGPVWARPYAPVAVIMLPMWLS